MKKPTRAPVPAGQSISTTRAREKAMAEGYATALGRRHPEPLSPRAKKYESDFREGFAIGEKERLAATQ